MFFPCSSASISRHTQIDGIDYSDLSDKSTPLNTHFHISLVSALDASDAVGPGLSNIRLGAPAQSQLAGLTNVPFTIDGYGTSHGTLASAFSLAAGDLGNMWSGELTKCAPCRRSRLVSARASVCL